MSLRELSIKNKLFLLSAMGLAFVIAVAIAGSWGISRLQESSHEMGTKFSALRNTLEADMMRDAVRADVLAILRAANLSDKKQIDEAVAALKKHGAWFRQALAKNETLALNAKTKQALATVKPSLEEYLAGAEKISTTAITDVAAASTLYPPFQQTFAKLEDDNKQLNDLLEASHVESTKDTDLSATLANRTLIILTLLSIIVSLIFSTLFAKHVTGSIKQALGMAQRVTRGHLDDRSDGITSTDEAGQLISSMNEMRRALANIVEQVRSGARAVYSAADQITVGNESLSRRTEHQAATLEETAASTEELAATVRETAQDAREANERAAHAGDMAVRGGRIANEAVQTMADISDSAKRIADITSIIDGIALQTNILALNAAVEAARAGEQGRGFAVVASEVRALAQRCAGAAKEIKQQIGASIVKVEAGSALVTKAGQAMDEIINSVRSVTELISKVAATTEEQGQGIDQVNQAISQLDGVAQQNAAMVEEASAAAESLRDEVQSLTQLVDQFKISSTAPAHEINVTRTQKPMAPRRATLKQTAPPKTPVLEKRNAPSSRDENWAEF
jgi:methyl-accepting chemotaxis protein